MITGFISAFAALYTDDDYWHFGLNLVSSVYTVLLLVYAGRTGRYRRCFLSTVIFMFIIITPLLFFTGYGYKGAMPFFFIFAIVFTSLMLEGSLRTVFAVSEFILYSSCCLIEYQLFGSIAPDLTERENMISIITSFISVGFTLYTVILLYMRIYNNRQKQLEGMNRLKTEFLQDISHEMQNPLTTITRGIGFARSRIDKPGSSQAAIDALEIAEDEAMRLGRMVASMVKLAKMSGGTESREKIDFREILVNCAETFRLQLDNRENILSINIASNLPCVYGVSDQLKQVLINLLSNTAKHTRNSTVTLEAYCNDAFITVLVSDTGDGISPELLPHVFERGVSSKESLGYGLSICRTIMEAHGGEIDIKSELHKGTTVTFTIPVYGGQSETRGESE